MTKRIKAVKRMKACGHRLQDRHFAKISNKAQKWKIKDAAALRRMIDEA